jgi:hypothetical protein
MFSVMNDFTLSIITAAKKSVRRNYASSKWAVCFFLEPNLSPMHLQRWGAFYRVEKIF